MARNMFPSGSSAEKPNKVFRAHKRAAAPAFRLPEFSPFPVPRLPWQQPLVTPFPMQQCLPPLTELQFLRFYQQSAIIRQQQALMLAMRAQLPLDLSLNRNPSKLSSLDSGMSSAESGKEESTSDNSPRTTSEDEVSPSASSSNLVSSDNEGKSPTGVVEDGGAPSTSRAAGSSSIEEDFSRFVVITPEAKAELARIENKIGDYVCQLCETWFPDAFQLAGHNCPQIETVEYICSECSKKFSCPANLASHRRWHRPQNQVSSPGDTKKATQQQSRTVSQKKTNKKPENEQMLHKCDSCGKRFKRMSYMKKHTLNCQQTKKLKANWKLSNFSVDSLISTPTTNDTAELPEAGMESTTAVQ